jgi:hypothetical protein
LVTWGTPVSHSNFVKISVFFVHCTFIQNFPMTWTWNKYMQGTCKVIFKDYFFFNIYIFLYFHSCHLEKKINNMNLNISLIYALCIVW